MSLIKQEKREIIVVITLVALCLLSSVLGMVLLKDGQGQIHSGNEVKKELLSQIGNYQDYIPIIGLEGVIYDGFAKSSPFSSATDAISCKQELQKALDDKKAKAVLLRMNSPGGTVAASQEIYQLVKKLREAKKPVLVSMGDICGSGCYYIASAANSIVANPGTLTGSIGVISQGVNLKGFFDRLGIKDQTFKAGKFKDIGSSQRELIPEEISILNKLLENSYDQFLNDIHAGRGIEIDKLQIIARGIIYTGSQAKEVGLVDHLGTLEDSKVILKDLLKTKYKVKGADSLAFRETWDGGQFSSLEGLFGMKMSQKDSIKNLLTGENGTASSIFQPLWLMER